MNKSNKEKLLSIASICLIFDQLIKILIRAKINIHEEIPIIPKFFSLYNTANTGAAFSLFNGKTIFLIIISFIALVAIYTYIKQTKNISSLSLTSLGLIYGGILGNLIDRLLYRAVTDYLLFYLGNNSFPIFNLADIFITGGIFLYFLSEFVLPKIAQRKKI